MAALAEPKGRYGASQWARAAVSPAAPSALRPGRLGGQRDLGDIGVAGEEDQLVAAGIGEDGQRLIRTACRTRTGPVGSIRTGVCHFTPATARLGGSCCVCRGTRRGIPRWVVW